MFTIFISVSAYFYPNKDVDSIYWSFGGISLLKNHIFLYTTHNTHHTHVNRTEQIDREKRVQNTEAFAPVYTDEILPSNELKFLRCNLPIRDVNILKE